MHRQIERFSHTYIYNMYIERRKDKLKYYLSGKSITINRQVDRWKDNFIKTHKHRKKIRQAEVLSYR